MGSFPDHRDDPESPGPLFTPQTWGTEVRGRGVSWAAPWKADSAVGRAPPLQGRGVGGGRGRRNRLQGRTPSV